MKNENKNIKVDKTSPEIRAYIYQQLSELEHMIPKGSAIAITVDEDGKSKKYVSIVLKTAAGDLTVDSSKKDIYEAINEAKTNLQVQLGHLANWVDEDGMHEGAIDVLLKHKYLH